MARGRSHEHPTLDTIAAAYAAVVLAHQQHVGVLFDERGWSLDLDSRTLTLGDHSLRVVPLARVADPGEAWQWAWSWQVGGVADPRLVELVEIGRRFDVPELTSAALRLGGVYDGGQGPEHTLALAACGLLGAHGYFPARYDGGTLWLLLGETMHPAPPPTRATLIDLLTAAVAMFPHHNRLTVETYLAVHGLVAGGDARRLTTPLADGAVTVTFDQLDRLRAIG